MWFRRTSSESEGFGGLKRQEIVRALWLILAGAVVASLAFGPVIPIHDQTDWNLHITAQPVGVFLIIISVLALSLVDADRDYKLFMRVILAIQIAHLASSVVGWFPSASDSGTGVVRIFIECLVIFSAIGFCKCLQWFCQDSRLWKSARGWRTTSTVFICYGGMLGLVEFIRLLALLKVLDLHQTPDPNSPPGLPSWFLFFVPALVGLPIAFAMSILRMNKDMVREESAEARPVPILPDRPSRGRVRSELGPADSAGPETSEIEPSSAEE